MGAAGAIILGAAKRRLSWDLIRQATESTAKLSAFVLAGVIAIAMSLFLSIGAAVQNASAKSFHYAPGLGERTEAFLCLSVMILDQAHLVLWTWVFVALIVFTMGQRLVHVRDLLRD